jgi:Tol biopolymer transport system component
MARGTLYLPVMIAAAVACLVALSAVSGEAGASFPGKNGRIAYVAFGGNNSGIYTIKPDRSGKTRITNNAREEDDPAYSPSGKRIAFSGYDGHDTEIYTINVGGGGKSQVTDTVHYARSPSWGSRP